MARAIDYEMKRGGFDCVYLDISHKPADEILHLFPNIAARCREFGIDITRQPIPVVPAAHYTCGGVVTDLDGATDLPGLYAVGECAFTGPARGQPAGQQLAAGVRRVRRRGRRAHRARSPLLPHGGPAACRRGTRAGSPIPTSRSSSPTTGTSCGASCGTTSASCAPTSAWSAPRHRVRLLQEEIGEFYGNFRVTNDLIELRNLALVAELIIRSAQLRHESRGLHYNRDYPVTLPEGQAARHDPDAGGGEIGAAGRG